VLLTSHSIASCNHPAEGLAFTESLYECATQAAYAYLLTQSRSANTTTHTHTPRSRPRLPPRREKRRGGVDFCSHHPSSFFCLSNPVSGIPSWIFTKILKQERATSSSEFPWHPRLFLLVATSINPPGTISLIQSTSISSPDPLAAAALLYFGEDSALRLSFAFSTLPSRHGLTHSERAVSLRSWPLVSSSHGQAFDKPRKYRSLVTAGGKSIDFVAEPRSG
jgi:hypothetical protein